MRPIATESLSSVSSVPLAIAAFAAATFASRMGGRRFISPSQRATSETSTRSAATIRDEVEVGSALRRTLAALRPEVAAELDEEPTCEPTCEPNEALTDEPMLPMSAISILLGVSVAFPATTRSCTKPNHPGSVRWVQISNHAMPRPASCPPLHRRTCRKNLSRRYNRTIAVSTCN